MKEKINIIEDRDDRKVSQEQYENKCGNIYECVMVIGQRMREIERKNAEEFERARNSYIDERTDKEYRNEFVSDIHEDDLPVFPKAIRQSMNEMLNDELEWEYEDLTKLES